MNNYRCKLSTKHRSSQIQFSGNSAIQIQGVLNLLCVVEVLKTAVDYFLAVGEAIKTRELLTTPNSSSPRLRCICITGLP